jgi:hypothetical protein
MDTDEDSSITIKYNTIYEDEEGCGDEDITDDMVLSGTTTTDDPAWDNSTVDLDYGGHSPDYIMHPTTLDIYKLVLPDDTTWKGKKLEEHLKSKIQMNADVLTLWGDHIIITNSKIRDLFLMGDHATVQYSEIGYCLDEPLKGEENMKVTHLDFGIWVAIFVVGIIAAKVAPRINWRVLLWPIKKLFRIGQKEVKVVKAEWQDLDVGEEEAVE